MNNLLLRRRALMGMKTSKPYDAQIEYLCSTGTQYIDTDIVPDENTGLLARIVRDDSRDSFAIGLRDTVDDTRWCIGVNSSRQFYAGYGGITITTISGVDGVAKINFLNKKKFKVNLATYVDNSQDLPSLPFQPVNNIRLFGTSGIEADCTKWIGKIYLVKISQGDNIIMDLIPVRKGTKGYMYDKISGKLFDNDGSGDFILGPDIPNKRIGYKIPKQGQYAVTAADNPEWMLFLYENGIAASPDYCTFEEAAAVENFSGMTIPTPIIHVDLRYFTGVVDNHDITLVSSKTNKLTLPNTPLATNTGMAGSYNAANPYTLIIPSKVEHFPPNAINASWNQAYYIFEGNTPPSHDWFSSLKNRRNDGHGLLAAVYVPDSAVDIYKTTNINNGNTAHYLYAEYADYIFPHSDYIEPTE